MKDGTALSELRLPSLVTDYNQIAAFTALRLITLQVSCNLKFIYSANYFQIIVFTN